MAYPRMPWAGSQRPPLTRVTEHCARGGKVSGNPGQRRQGPPRSRGHRRAQGCRASPTSARSSMSRTSAVRRCGSRSSPITWRASSTASRTALAGRRFPRLRHPPSWPDRRRCGGIGTPAPAAPGGRPRGRWPAGRCGGRPPRRRQGDRVGPARGRGLPSPRHPPARCGRAPGSPAGRGPRQTGAAGRAAAPPRQANLVLREALSRHHAGRDASDNRAAAHSPGHASGNFSAWHRSARGHRRASAVPERGPELRRPDCEHRSERGAGGADLLSTTRTTGSCFRHPRFASVDAPLPAWPAA